MRNKPAGRRLTLQLRLPPTGWDTATATAAVARGNSMPCASVDAQGGRLVGQQLVERYARLLHMHPESVKAGTDHVLVQCRPRPPPSHHRHSSPHRHDQPCHSGRFTPRRAACPGRRAVPGHPRLPPHTMVIGGGQKGGREAEAQPPPWTAATHGRRSRWRPSTE